MRCPFGPNCRANFGMFRPILGSPHSLVEPYPSHSVVGPEGSIRGILCPGSGVRMLRSGEVHAGEHARLAEHFEIWAEAEAQRRRDEPAELAEFDDFAERAARAVEERMRIRNAGREVPFSAEGLLIGDGPGELGYDETIRRQRAVREILNDHSTDSAEREQTIREILNDKTIRLIEGRRTDEPADVAEFWRRRGWTAEGPPPGYPLGEREPGPPDAYPDNLEQGDDEWPTPSELAEFNAGDGMLLGDAPSRPVDEYFPGRPADAPEPGPGESPGTHVPMDAPLDLTPIGRTAVDNARDQLRGLLAAVIDQVGQGQDTLAKATAMTDSVEAYRMATGQAVQSAETLVTVALGSATDVPQPAENLRAAVISAKTMLDEAGLMHNAIELLRERIGEIHQELGAAVEAAREYIAIP